MRHMRTCTRGRLAVTLTAALFLAPACAPAASGGDPMVQAACSEVAEIAMNQHARGIRRAAGEVSDPRTGVGGPGCIVTADGAPDAAEKGFPHEGMADLMPSRGWERDPAYDADGADGTAFALRRRNVVCFLSATWGDAAPEPQGYTFRAACRAAP